MKTNSTKQQGFSLIEMMVAMVIGLLIVLAATTSASFFEANRRNTHGNIAATENGIAALNTIQRETKNAGIFSFGTSSETCKKIYVLNEDGDFSEMDFMPVILTKGADSKTADSIQILGISNLSAEKVPLTVSEKNGGGNWPGADFGIKSNLIADVPSDVVSADDNVLIARPSGDCYVAKVTQVQDEAMKIQTRPSYKGASANALPANYDIPANSTVYGLGNGNQTDYRYSVVKSNKSYNFEENSVHTETKSIIAENIVHLRAQYGISDDVNKLNIKKWVNAGSTTANAENIRAIRIALVARSAQKIKPSVGSECDATTSNPIVPWNLDGESAEKLDESLDADKQPIDIGISSDAEAKCYQYKVMTMTIPLQNYLFRGGLTGVTKQ